MAGEGAAFWTKGVDKYIKYQISKKYIDNIK